MTTLIAEVASGHGGDMAVADNLIGDAAEAGADYVKFQSYQTFHLSQDDPQYDWLQKAELSDADHRHLIATCRARRVGFLTTVFHEDRVDFLASLHLPAIKIGSGEAMRVPLLREVAKHPWTVYLSTGLCTMDELDEANDILGDRDVVYLHCVSKYPAYPSDCNMGRMAYLRDRYARPVGYSDHTVGVAAAQHAISLGARAVEVHVRSDLRSQMWDKSLSDVSSLDIHRLVVEKMMLVHAMGWRENEPRPYVGRWAHGF